jgi:hypothetical protein
MTMIDGIKKQFFKLLHEAHLLPLQCQTPQSAKWNTHSQHISLVKAVIRFVFIIDVSFVCLLFRCFFNAAVCEVEHAQPTHQSGEGGHQVRTARSCCFVVNSFVVFRLF